MTADQKTNHTVCDIESNIKKYAMALQFTMRRTDFFSVLLQIAKTSDLMAAMHSINRKMGKESIKLASKGFTRPWKMKQENKSPSYATSWVDLPVR